MGHRNYKRLCLITIGILMVGLIAVTGCGGTSSGGTSGSGSTGDSGTSAGDTGSPIEVTAAQLASNYNNYIGKNVVLKNEKVASKTAAYIMIGSIRIEPQNPSDLETIKAGDYVDVEGQVYGLSGGVVTIKNCQIELVVCVE